MTKDDIMRMAREAGFAAVLEEHASEYGNGTFENTPYPELERFATLVAAQEREECAKLCESRQTPGTGSVAILNGAADAIRARTTP